MKRALANVLIVSLGFSLIAGAGEPKKKYGAHVVPLSIDHHYFTHSDALDYWVLQGFGADQRTNSSCSVATITTLLNAVRNFDGSAKDERHLTELMVLNQVNNSKWTNAVKNNGGGVNFQQFNEYLLQAFAAYGYSEAQAREVQVSGSRNLQGFVNDLRENEKSNTNFMMLNFDQGFVMDDDPVGHFALVAGFDSDTSRVLILDPDRKWYEPYWAPAAKVFDAMNGRGYVFFVPGPHAP